MNGGEPQAPCPPRAPVKWFSCRSLWKDYFSWNPLLLYFFPCIWLWTYSRAPLDPEAPTPHGLPGTKPSPIQSMMLPAFPRSCSEAQGSPWSAERALVQWSRCPAQKHMPLCLCFVTTRLTCWRKVTMTPEARAVTVSLWVEWLSSINPTGGTRLWGSTATLGLFESSFSIVQRAEHATRSCVTLGELLSLSVSSPIEWTASRGKSRCCVLPARPRSPQHFPPALWTDGCIGGSRNLRTYHAT